MIPGGKRLELYNKLGKQARAISNELFWLSIFVPLDEWEEKTKSRFIREQLKRQRLERERERQNK